MDKPEINKDWKRYVFYLHTDTHVEMLLKLRYDRMHTKQFFKKLIRAYVEDHPLMRDLIRDINKENISVRSAKKMRKNDRLEKKIEKNFNLTDDEINDIYDQIELDEPNE